MTKFDLIIKGEESSLKVIWHNRKVALGSNRVCAQSNPEPLYKMGNTKTQTKCKLGMKIRTFWNSPGIVDFDLFSIISKFVEIRITVKSISLKVSYDEP